MARKFANNCRFESKCAMYSTGCRYCVTCTVSLRAMLTVMLFEILLANARYRGVAGFCS